MSITSFRASASIVLLAFGMLDALGDEVARQRPPEQLYDSASLERQFQALSAMPKVDVTYDKFGRAKTIIGDTGLVLREPARFRKGDSGEELLLLLKDVLLATGKETMTISKNEVWVGGIRTIKIGQTIRGRPVLDGLISLSVDSDTGRITVVNSQFVPEVGLPLDAQISADDAIAAIRRNLVDGGYAVDGTVSVDTAPTLVYVARPPDDEKPKLVWRVLTQYMKPDDELTLVEVWVNAVDSSIIHVGDATRAALSRTVYTAKNVSPPPSATTFPSGLTLISATFDTYSQAAYDHVGTAYNAWNAFGETYGPVRIVVHYDQGWNRAQFVPRRVTGDFDYLLFGDGAPNFLPPSKDRDTVAHEFGHGVFDDNIDAVWSGVGTDDSLALDEAFGDMSAVITDIWSRGGAATTSTWELYQRNLLDPLAPSVSWSNPKSASTNFTDWYPDWYRGLNARHYNATVLGHAYYLLAKGGSHVRKGQAVTGGVIPSLVVTQQGLDKTARIFFVAMNSPLIDPDLRYIRLRAATEAAASALYPTDPAVKDNVTRAWQAVGVGFNCAVAPGTVNYSVESFYCRGSYTVNWTDVAGALTYEGQFVRSGGFPWSMATTIIDVNQGKESCRIGVPSNGRFRMRACNGCGCGPWGYEYSVY